MPANMDATDIFPLVYLLCSLVLLQPKLLRLLYRLCRKVSNGQSIIVNLKCMKQNESKNCLAQSAMCFGGEHFGFYRDTIAYVCTPHIENSSQHLV